MLVCVCVSFCLFASGTKNTKKKQNFATLVTKISEQDVVPRLLFLERVSITVLNNSDVTRMSQMDFDKAKNRIRTAHFYKQEKFNLMREEVEGCVRTCPGSWLFKAVRPHAPTIASHHS